MAVKVKVDMKPVNTILTRLGINETGDVQMQATRIINQRITRYMPYRTGVLAMKSKYIKSPTEIEVLGPYAKYQYYGELMVDHITRSAWSPKYSWKVRTGIPLNYHRPGNGEGGAGNPLAGPKWDKRMMAAEGAQIAKEIQTYVDRKAGKR